MGGTPRQSGPPPLLLVDGHNLLWSATFGFPAAVRSRDKSRDLTGLFAFFALLRVAVRNDVPGGSAEIIVVFDGEFGAVNRQAVDSRYKAQRASGDAELAPTRFLPNVKRLGSSPMSSGDSTTAASPGSRSHRPKPMTSSPPWLPQHRHPALSCSCPATRTTTSSSTSG